MFESGITARELVRSIISEVDAAPDIPEETYYTWIDEVEQLLYSEIIREMVCSTLTPKQPQKIRLSEIEHIDADAPRFEDVVSVFADNKQLIRATPIGGVIFPDSYWKQENDLYYNVSPEPETIRVFYYIRPELKVTKADSTIKLPPEWVRIIRAKLRGEAYKLVNEDTASAKWLNDHNVLLEQFKQYIAQRKAEIGV